MRRFEDKVAIVRSAGTGIGEAMPSASHAIASPAGKRWGKSDS